MLWRFLQLELLALRGLVRYLLAQSLSILRILYLESSLAPFQISFMLIDLAFDRHFADRPFINLILYI